MISKRRRSSKGKGEEGKVEAGQAVLEREPLDGPDNIYDLNNFLDVFLTDTWMRNWMVELKIANECKFREPRHVSTYVTCIMADA